MRLGGLGAFKGEKSRAQRAGGNVGMVMEGLVCMMPRGGGCR